MPHPTLVLVHGCWHGPAHFGPLVRQLETYSYKCISVSLPDVAPLGSLPAGTFEDSCSLIRQTIMSELDDGYNVAVVAHSFGGATTNACLEGLDAAARLADGKKTAVVGIVLLAAHIVPPGMSALDLVAALRDLELIRLDYSDKDYITVAELGPVYYFYNDLPTDEAEMWSEKLLPNSIHVFSTKTASFAPTLIPTSYLKCLKDRTWVPAAVDRMLQFAAEAGAKIRVETCDMSHSPFLKDPAFTCDYIRRSIGEKL